MLVITYLINELFNNTRYTDYYEEEDTIINFSSNILKNKNDTNLPIKKIEIKLIDNDKIKEFKFSNEINTIKKIIFYCNSFILNLNKYKEIQINILYNNEYYANNDEIYNNLEKLICIYSKMIKVRRLLLIYNNVSLIKNKYTSDEKIKLIINNNKQLKKYVLYLRNTIFVIIYKIISGKETELKNKDVIKDIENTIIKIEKNINEINNILNDNKI